MPSCFVGLSLRYPPGHKLEVQVVWLNRFNWILVIPSSFLSRSVPRLILDSSGLSKNYFNIGHVITKVWVVRISEHLVPCHTVPWPDRLPKSIESHSHSLMHDPRSLRYRCRLTWMLDGSLS